MKRLYCFVPDGKCFFLLKLGRVESAVRGETRFGRATPLEQRASERVFGFENSVKYFGGITFRKTRLQYMIMRKKYAYSSGIEGFVSICFMFHVLPCSSC